jgi:hypothetical protein
MSETEQAKPTESKPKASRKPKAKKAWAGNFYIRGYGRVYVGDEATKEQLSAWKAITDVKPKVEDVTDIPTEPSK